MIAETDIRNKEAIIKRKSVYMQLRGQLEEMQNLMVDREGKFAEFTIKGEEFDEYCDKWAQRLADYFNK